MKEGHVVSQGRKRMAVPRPLMRNRRLVLVFSREKEKGEGFAYSHS
jgi:hypothetical protein